MTTTVNLTRPGVLSDLVAYGSKTAGTPSLRPGFQTPVPGLEVEFAPAARWLNGEIATGVRTPNAVIGMPLRFQALTEAALQTLVDEWRAALRQLTYTATIVLGDQTTAWKAYPGQIVLTNGQRREVIAGQPVLEFYTVTIPVHPIPITGA